MFPHLFSVFLYSPSVVPARFPEEQCVSGFTSFLGGFSEIMKWECNFMCFCFG